MKKTFLSFIMLFACCSLHAEKLRVVLLNGETTFFAFSNRPVAKFANGECTISTSSSSVSFKTNEVKSFEILHIFDTKVDDVIETTDSAPIRIYNTQGMLIKSSNEGKLDYSNLPSGMYIIKQGKTNYKVYVP